MSTSATPNSDGWKADIDAALREVAREAAAQGIIPWRANLATPRVSVYVRVTSQLILYPHTEPKRRKTIDLASIEVQDSRDEPRQGVCKYVVERLQSIAKESGRVLYIENVHNPYLRKYFSEHPDFVRLRNVDGFGGVCYATRPPR